MRTIYRDIDALCEAGIPIAAYPGAGGGYGMRESFKIDRSILKPEEIGQVSAALGSLSPTFGDERMSAGGRSPQGHDSPKGRVAGRSPCPRTTSSSSSTPADAIARRSAGSGEPSRRGASSRFGYVDGGQRRAAAGRALSHRLHLAGLVPLRLLQEPRGFPAVQDRAHRSARDDARALCAADPSTSTRGPGTRPGNRGLPSPRVIRFADAARIEEHFDAEAIEREAGARPSCERACPSSEWAVSFLLGLGLAFEVLEPESLRSLVAERARQLLESNLSSATKLVDAFLGKP